MDLNLLGKTAVITGGSMGIGKAIARQLAYEGMEIVIAARTLDTLESAADEISKETGVNVSSVVVDTGDDLSVIQMVKKSIDLLGRVDVLVNCAAIPGGMSPAPELDNITNDQFWSDMNIKVLGYLRCAKEVSYNMKKNGWGRIINNFLVVNRRVVYVCPFRKLLLFQKRLPILERFKSPFQKPFRLFFLGRDPVNYLFI